MPRNAMLKELKRGESDHLISVYLSGSGYSLEVVNQGQPSDPLLPPRL